MGVSRRLSPVPGAGFGQDAVDVGFDRRLRDVQLLGYFTIGAALGDQRQDLGLAFGQPVGERGLGPLARPSALRSRARPRSACTPARAASSSRACTAGSRTP